MPRGPVRIDPHLRAEPDYNALAVAALLLLDELEAKDRRRRTEHPDDGSARADSRQ